jgi:hypothetical protein
MHFNTTRLSRLTTTKARPATRTRRLARTTSRVCMLLTLFLLAAHLNWARLANPHAGTGTPVAQETPQSPAQKPVPPAKAQPLVPPVENAQPSLTHEEMDRQQKLEEQLIGIRQQVEQEVLNRMQSGGYGYNAFDRFMDGFLPFLVFIGVTLALLWFVREIVEHKRWNKMVKVQTDTHAKLLDRFGSSQEMLAYMQSEAGKKFLATPIFEGQRRQVSTLPFGRILWSVQAGIVAVFVGAGFLFLRGKVTPDADMGFQVFGTLVLTLGLGFLVSGGVSYVLAKYFGLLQPPDTLTRTEHNA